MNTLRRCARCHEEKAYKEFYRDGSRSCGYGNTCKVCDNEKNKENSAKRREERRKEKYLLGKGRTFIEDTETRIKELRSVPCMDCGNSFPSICMDFDHRVPSLKLFAISAWRGYSPAAIENEIAKCDVVCSNCHRIRTQSRY